MNTETITCDCGTEFQWEYEGTDPKWLRVMRPRLCDHCWDSREAALREEQRLEREQRLANAIAQMRSCVANQWPRLFRGTDVDHERFNATGWARVKDWQPSDEKPWLGMIGESGTCKSRIAFLLASAEMERQVTQRHLNSDQRIPVMPRFRHVAYYEITEIAALLQTGTFEQKDIARTELDALRRADLLVIDDFGKGRMNTAIAAEMFALIDYRYGWLLPTIWTANSTPEVIAANMAEDMAGPFAGRINDSSRIVRFK